MREASLERRLYLPYSAVQLFDLVADIEHYPEFVPGWRKSKVTHREEGRLTVEQAIRIGPTDWRFVTEARLHRPREIRISAVDAPFGNLSIDWIFEPLDDSGCAVVFQARYQTGPRVLRRFAADLLEGRLLQLIQAFEARARVLYDPNNGPA